MLNRPLRCAALFSLALFLYVGCTDEAPPELGPAAGWEGTSARWWRTGIDTVQAFRDLETLEAMQVSDVSMDLADEQGAMVVSVSDGQLAHAVKRSLIRLYRNEPEIVDSLFRRFVTPEIEATPVSGDVGAYVERFKRRGYELIRSHFREPLAATSLGEDVPVVYPDSLRERGVGGSVRMQIFVDEEGKPHAIRILEGVHPVLNALALTAMSQMEWRPAYLLRKGNWYAIPSWTVMSVTYQAPQ